MADQISELNAKIARLETDYDDLRGRVHSVELTATAYEVHHANVDRRLTNIENGQKWVIQLIIGAIILGLIGLLWGQGLNS